MIYGKVYRLIAVISICLALTSSGCDRSSESPHDSGVTVTVNVVDGCKSSTSASLTSHTNDECIEWEYDTGDGTLRIRHVNSGFNCCILGVTADVAVNRDTILIHEFEQLDDGGCRCLCLYNLEFSAAVIDPGAYVMRVSGPYMAPWQPDSGESADIIFTCNLADDSNGTYCVSREHYPWN
jgi:hypothetical protein